MLCRTISVHLGVIIITLSLSSYHYHVIITMLSSPCCHYHVIIIMLSSSCYHCGWYFLFHLLRKLGLNLSAKSNTIFLWKQNSEISPNLRCYKTRNFRENFLTWEDYTFPLIRKQSRVHFLFKIWFEISIRKFSIWRITSTIVSKRTMSQHVLRPQGTQGFTSSFVLMYLLLWRHYHVTSAGDRDGLITWNRVGKSFRYIDECVMITRTWAFKESISLSKFGVLFFLFFFCLFEKKNWRWSGRAEKSPGCGHAMFPY